jgi:hypothetical protein
MIHVSVPDKNRGDLLKINLESLLFSAKEVVTISNVPIGTRRGCHAHIVTKQLLVLVSGKINVRIITSQSDSEVTLEKSGDHVYLPALSWGEQTFLSPNSVLQVYSSEIYDAGDYISDFDTLIKHWGVTG